MLDFGFLKLEKPLQRHLTPATEEQKKRLIFAWSRFLITLNMKFSPLITVLALTIITYGIKVAVAKKIAPPQKEPQKELTDKEHEMDRPKAQKKSAISDAEIIEPKKKKEEPIKDIEKTVKEVVKETPKKDEPAKKTVCVAELMNINKKN
jgi:flagellar biosynthesis/type III secretory pathway M-ring protein FliF/YscJ